MVEETENTGVKDTVEIDATPEETPTAENDSQSFPEDDLGFSEEDLGENESETADIPAEKTEPVEPEPPKAKGAEARKEQLNNEIRDKVAERNALKEEIARLNQEKYRITEQIPTVDTLMEQVNPDTGDYYTRLEAQIAQMQAERQAEKQQYALNAYTEKIVENRMALRSEGERVLRDFPMFDDNSPEFSPELAQRADAILRTALIQDETTGSIIGCKVPLYDLYATIATAAQSAKIEGKMEGRRATQKMMGAVDVAGSVSSASGKAEPDDFLSGFLKD